MGVGVEPLARSTVSVPVVQKLGSPHAPSFAYMQVLLRLVPSFAYRLVSSLQESESVGAGVVAVAASGAQLKISSTVGTLSVGGAQLRSIRIVALAISVETEDSVGVTGLAFDTQPV